ncbi:MAG: ABC transporter substrate-binding protein [Bdellovibrionota bacterium]
MPCYSSYTVRHLVIAVLLVVAAPAWFGCTRKRELGNVVRVALRDKPRSLDPAIAHDYYSHVLLRRAYEGLVQYHYLKRPYELEPLLIETMPAVSKDQKTYTFRLKQGVRFHDDKAFKDGKGRPLRAQDFVYSFKRLADPKVGSTGWWILDGLIVGLNEWRDQALESGQTAYDASVGGLKAIDDHTLQVRLTKPFPLFLHRLTMPYANVVAREVVEFYGKDFQNHPVGTGPFRLTNFTQNQWVWERNPSYHPQIYPKEGSEGDKELGLLKDAGKPIPFLDKIIDDILIEDQPTWLSFMKGDHDYLMRIPKDNPAAAISSDGKPSKEIRDKHIQLHLTPSVAFNYIVFNMEDPVVGGEKNKFLRKAISLAFDEAPAIEKFYLGLGLKAESPIPPGIWGYDPNYRNPSRQYSLVKAREILAKAGHADGRGVPELTYDVQTGQVYRQLGEYFQRSVAELGIKVNLNVVLWPEMMKRARQKQVQILGLSWVYDYPDAENGWQLLYSRNEAPGSNLANYENPKFDRLYEQAAVLPNGAQRKALFVKMREMLSEDVPWVLTVHQNESRLSHGWTHNLKIHAFEHCAEKYLRVDLDGRNRALRHGIGVSEP